MINNFTFDEFLRKFKELEGPKTDQEIAKTLGIRQSTFSLKRKRGDIPYPQLINFLIKKELSLDQFFKGRIYSPEIQGTVETLIYILEHGDKETKNIVRGDISREYRRLKETEEAKKSPKVVGEKKEV